MARFSGPGRRLRPTPPPVPYYAEGELVRERVVVEEPVVPVVEDGNPLLWLLLLPVLALLGLGLYLLLDDDETTVVNDPRPAPTVVVTQPPTVPPVVITQAPAPPVVVIQPPAPQQSSAPTQEPAPTSS